jgi:hypothetical protein
VSTLRRAWALMGVPGTLGILLFTVVWGVLGVRDVQQHHDTWRVLVDVMGWAGGVLYVVHDQRSRRRREAVYNEAKHAIGQIRARGGELPDATEEELHAIERWLEL